jgi:hypothetical protein
MVFIVIERNESVKTMVSTNKKSFHVGSNSFEHSFPVAPVLPVVRERHYRLWLLSFFASFLVLKTIREICGIRGCMAFLFLLFLPRFAPVVLLLRVIRIIRGQERSFFDPRVSDPLRLGAGGTLAASVKLEETYENKRSSGLSVRSRRDRHPKKPIKSGNFPLRLPAAAGGANWISVRISVRTRSHLFAFLCGHAAVRTFTGQEIWGHDASSCPH